MDLGLAGAAGYAPTGGGPAAGPSRTGGLPPRERRAPSWVVPAGATVLEAAAFLALGAALDLASGVALTPAVVAAAGGYLLLASRPGAAAGTDVPGGGVLAAFACGLLGTVAVAGLPAAPWVPAVVAWVAASLLASAAIRRGAALLVRRVPHFHPARRRVAIVGNGQGAAAVLDALRRAGGEAGAGLPEVVGYFDDRASRPGPLTGRLPHLGPVDRLVTFVEDGELSDVYLALPWSADERIAGIADRLRFLPLTLHLAPAEALPAAVGTGEVGRVVHPVLLRPPIPAAGLRLKSVFDGAAGFALLLAFSPVLLAAAVLIRLDGPGPIFFRQTRIGRYGRRFSILKFRTLRPEASDAAAETLVTKGDARVTRIGRVLRKYSIDELPQILNVLRGEMSLVGPRPHAPKAKADGRLYADVVPDYLRRYRVRPGLTGWAQVNGHRGETDTEEKLRNRVAYDFDYIRGWSFLLDLHILLRTIPATLAPPAYNR